MSIKDVIKSSFLEGMGYSAPTMKTILISFLVALLLGCFIYLIYRLMTSKSFYSAHFGLSLILITIITTAIILTIQNSVIVSLGMVGALSIVRFRTAVKDPLDLVYLFWAISGGIISGTGMIGLAISLSLFITLVLIVYRIVPSKKDNNILLSVQAKDAEVSGKIKDLLKEEDENFKVQSGNLSAGGYSMMAELRCNDTDALMKKIYELENINSVSVVAHGGKTEE
jgi:uncharacterized membrane protein YhiD involved in acid resistance